MSAAVHTGIVGLHRRSSQPMPQLRRGQMAEWQQHVFCVFTAIQDEALCMHRRYGQPVPQLRRGQCGTMASTALHTAGASLACRSSRFAGTSLCGVTMSQHPGLQRVRHFLCFVSIPFLQGFFWASARMKLYWPGCAMTIFAPVKCNTCGMVFAYMLRANKQNMQKGWQGA